MTGSETQDRIDGQAALWAARNALAEMTAAEKAEFEAWLVADRRHEGAYLRAQASYYVLEEAVLASPAPTASNDDEPLASAAPPRRFGLGRWAIGAGLAVAACAGAAFVIGAPGVAVWQSPGGQSARAMTLADGSSVTLGRNGAIAAAMEGGVRRITLRQGSATFHVAKDRHRPFIVRSGNVYAEATGTVYSVRRVGTAGGAVSVTEGRVRVWAEGARDKAVMLHAGAALTIDPAQLATGRLAADRRHGEQTFWFDDTSIREAADRFNQVNATRIVIADPAIGKVTIMGGFRTDRPEQFAKAAAAITGARVVEREGTLVIEKP